MDFGDELNAYFRSWMAAREEQIMRLRRIAEAPLCSVLFPGGKRVEGHLVPLSMITGLPDNPLDGRAGVCVLYQNLPEALRKLADATGERPAYVAMVVPKDDIDMLEAKP